MIIVAATVIARPGCEDAVERQCIGLLAPTRAERGCERYAAGRDLVDGRVYRFYEHWRDRAALDAHFASAHFLAAKEAIGPLLEREPEILIFEV